MKMSNIVKKLRLVWYLYRVFDAHLWPQGVVHGSKYISKQICYDE
jgi:hypothetical protein